MLQPGPPSQKIKLKSCLYVPWFQLSYRHTYVVTAPNSWAQDVVEPDMTNVVQPDMTASSDCGDRAAHADPCSKF